MPYSPSIPRLTYHPLERLRVPAPVDRLPYIVAHARGRRVLDLGCYDETEIHAANSDAWRWLHAEIAAVATAVLGVDASADVRATGNIQTPAGSRIIYGTVEDLPAEAVAFAPEVIIAGELIEHTERPLDWLRALARTFTGVELVLTTPNATALINAALTLVSREVNHQDHLHVYSYKTLATIAARIPLRDAVLVPYYYNPHIFLRRVPRWIQPAIGVIDRAIVRPIQWAWPLTAYGWILRGRLG